MSDAWVSPLAEIERAVQEKAKLISLDLADQDGADRLRALIDDEVAGWSEEHKRGLRPFDLATPALVAERVFRNLAGYGPLESLLQDEDVWEVMVNAPDGALRKPDVNQLPTCSLICAPPLWGRIQKDEARANRQVSLVANPGTCDNEPHPKLPPVPAPDLAWSRAAERLEDTREQLAVWPLVRPVHCVMEPSAFEGGWHGHRCEPPFCV